MRENVANKKELPAKSKANQEHVECWKPNDDCSV